MKLKTVLNINIKGFVPTSMVDWPGKIISVIFLPGCNFRCSFCHNPELIFGYDKMEDIKIEDIFDYLKKRKEWIDGVCITGGEPTLHKNLPDFINLLSHMGYKVKLDTNGTNPKMLKKLIKNDLLDFVAMDIKAPLEKYSETTNVEINKEDINESIDILKNGKINYEFRTTIVPDFIGEEEMRKIGKWLLGAKHYIVQQFRPINTLDSKFIEKKSYTPDELQKLADVIKPYVRECKVRGI